MPKFLIIILLLLINIQTNYAAKQNLADNLTSDQSKLVDTKQIYESNKNIKKEFFQNNKLHDNFAQIPILHEGRIKPLDSFARFYLTILYGKDQSKDFTAIMWLSELLFTPQDAYKRKVFNISNPDVVTAINLPWRKYHKYSFNEVTKALAKQKHNIDLLYKKEQSQLSLAQNQLLELYIKNIAYYKISRSLSLLLSKFIINDPIIAKKFNVSVGQKFNYFDILPYKAEFTKFVNSDSLGIEQKNKILLELKSLAIDKDNNILKIIPISWHNQELFNSPWAILEQGQGSPETNSYFKLLSKLAIVYQNNQILKWQELSSKLEVKYNSNKVKLEYFYSNNNFLNKALYLYMMSLFFAIMTFLIKQRQNSYKKQYISHKNIKKVFYISSYVSLISGAILHFLGLALRIYITNRPPVATLYESIIFVSLIIILTAIFIEKHNKNTIGLLLGGILGVILQFIASKYAITTDTMQVLVAVLNSNFWLSTHVITITIGYGFCLILGTLAHFFLIKKLYFLINISKVQQAKIHIKQNNIIMSNAINNLTYMSLIALFFALLGTILGGIWADQSWGRFWGWDPKENGALLIVLWLIWILHGKIANMFTELSLAVTLAFTNIIVSLSWFGVNLLQVGLHSYGFTDNIASNLAIFCSLEVLFISIISILILYYQNKYRNLLL